MAEWKGKTRGGITGYKIFIAILRHLGMPFAYFLLYFVAFYFFAFSPESFRHIYYFYRKRLGFSFIKSVISVYRNYYKFGQVILDKTAALSGFDAHFTFEFEGEDYLHEMVKSGAGGLLISAHTGNFEMAGHMLERLDTKVNVLMLDAEHEKIKNYLSSLTRKSFNVIPISNDQSHVYAISEALKNQELICMHGDRFMPGSKTISAKFLGENALFPAGPFYLAMKYRVPVSFVFAMKDRRKKYHFYATSPVIYSLKSTQAGRDNMLRQIISDYIAVLEEKIFKYPYQWFNYYDFWYLDRSKESHG